MTYRIAELIRNGIAPIASWPSPSPTRRPTKCSSDRPPCWAAASRQARDFDLPLALRPDLARHIRQLGYPTAFAIYDRGDQEAWPGALREINVADAVFAARRPAAIISRGRRPRSARTGGRALAAADKEHLAASAYRRYQKALKTAGAVDFDDLLLCTEELFAAVSRGPAAEAGRFDHLLVDEYQDTNGSQYRIVKALAAGHRNLCVVGDDDQSIYGWRGAEVTQSSRFKHDWPAPSGPAGRELPLDRAKSSPGPTG